MKMSILRSMLMCVVLGCLLVNCGKEEPNDLPDWIQPIGKADDITPTDKVGVLVVTAPDGLEPNEQGIGFQTPLDFYLKAQDKETKIKLGQSYRISLDEVLIFMKREYDYRYYQKTLINVPKNAITTFQLAAIRFDWDPAMHQVDIGPVPQVFIDEYNINEPTSPFINYRLDFDPSMKPIEGQSNWDLPVVVIPGKYSIDFAPNAFNSYDQIIEIGSGQVIDNIVDKDMRGILKVYPPQRNLSNSPVGGEYCETTYRVTCGPEDNLVQAQEIYPDNHYLRYYQPYGSFLDPFNNGWCDKNDMEATAKEERCEGIRLLPINVWNDPVEFRAFPVEENSYDNYYYYVNGFAKSFNLETGITTEFHIGRIDVNPIQIESGGVGFPIEGSYTVSSHAGNDVFYGRDRWPTQTGVDVIEGLLYNLTITWINPDDQTTNNINWVCDYTQPPMGVSRCTEVNP